MSARINGNILTIDGVKTRLSPSERKILCAVMFHERVTDEALMEILWPDPDEMPDTWCNNIRVHTCRLHKKLKPSGWGVKKRYSKPLELVRLD